MKFAHIADCHVGGWREEALRKLSIDSLKKVIDVCIQENVAFLLISGDLFNTSLPQIDYIKEVASLFNMLKEADISIYIIPGSHDYSPSGKTMLEVFEHAGLVHNVMKFEDGKLQFTLDKTGTKITGLYGRRSGLDALDYATLQKEHLESEKGFKIFMFHTTLEEFKPKDFENVEGTSYSSMPKTFQYYAGGHVHYRFDIAKEGYGKIVYPGPVFPNNFKELEELKCGGMCIVDDKLNVRRIPLQLKEVVSLHCDVSNKTAAEARAFLEESLRNQEVKEKIVTLRISGELSSGKISDLQLHTLGEHLEMYALLQNTHMLSTKEFEAITPKGDTLEEIEEEILKNLKTPEHFSDFLKTFMLVLNDEKHEGERVGDFEERLLINLKTLFHETP